ncbi:MAG TPA: hypothetical protein H9951_00715, partial [Candidatus Bacteroides intestinigallinarum]|nr:hypothetical protein [Candidatus Bacteroides intestinigallinarum]
FEAPKENMDIEELDLNYPKAIYEERKGIWNRFLYYVLEINKTSYIKRVIGLPGERIQIEKGKVYINGNELEEPYLPPTPPVLFSNLYYEPYSPPPV